MTAFAIAWKPRRPGQTIALVPAHMCAMIPDRDVDHRLTATYIDRDQQHPWSWQVALSHGLTRDGTATTRVEAQEAAEAAFLAMPPEWKGTPR